MLVLKIAVILGMLAGLTLTLMPRLPGTLFILGAAIVYLWVAGATAPPWIMAALVVLSFTAEVGGRLLRIFLTRRYSLSRVFCVSSSVGNIGGILAADALLGPVLGLLAWEFFAGKTLAPRWDVVARVLLRLAAVATLRFGCGLLMVVLVLVYIMG
ncbi:DUF456 family protein [Anaeroselena agilis]|uniref:DUF456 family protein n=1 Tax=Anaeroselena agilis TaxID=3063788 RepID=A0ABU3NW33_9FIRM|nr:DUF456 family protein [Selenomonadales bacterium 4137-cl]